MHFSVFRDQVKLQRNQQVKKHLKVLTTYIHPSGFLGAGVSPKEKG